MSVFSNSIYNGEVTITRNRRWSANSVRRACIANHLYTCGDNEAYSKMLALADSHEPTTKIMYRVAKDIAEHSYEQTITNVMFILEHDSVITTFEIDGSDEV